MVRKYNDLDIYRCFDEIVNLGFNILSTEIREKPKEGYAKDYGGLTKNPELEAIDSVPRINSVEKILELIKTEEKQLCPLIKSLQYFVRTIDINITLKKYEKESILRNLADLPTDENPVKAKQFWSDIKKEMKVSEDSISKKLDTAFDKMLPSYITIRKRIDSLGNSISLFDKVTFMFAVFAAQGCYKSLVSAIHPRSENMKRVFITLKSPESQKLSEFQFVGIKLQLGNKGKTRDDMPRLISMKPGGNEILSNGTVWDIRFTHSLIMFLRDIKANDQVTEVYTGGVQREKIHVNDDSHVNGRAIDINGFAFSDHTVIHLRSGYPENFKESKWYYRSLVFDELRKIGRTSGRLTKLNKTKTDYKYGPSDWYENSLTINGGPTYRDKFRSLTQKMAEYFGMVMGPGSADESHMHWIHTELNHTPNKKITSEEEGWPANMDNYWPYVYKRLSKAVKREYDRPLEDYEDKSSMIPTPEGLMPGPRKL